MRNIAGDFALGLVGLSEDTAMLRTSFLTGCTPTASDIRITACQMVATYPEEPSLLQIRSVLIEYEIVCVRRLVSQRFTGTRSHLWGLETDGTLATFKFV